MKANQRYTISAIAYALITGKKISSIYSFEDGNFSNISCEVQQKNVSAYDYERGCHVSGSESSANKYSLYDYGASRHIDLTLENNKFSGYDYGSGAHYEGKVNNKSISFYDFGTGKFYDFSV